MLTFQVSGKLWNRSLVMADVETGSEWSHILGRCMAGPLKNQELRPLIADMVTWKQWVARHPHTTVLNMSRTAREYTAEFYRDPTQFVYGLMVGGHPLHLPMEQMQRRHVWQFEFDGRPFVAVFDATGAGVYVYSAQVGDEVLHFRPHDSETMQDRETGSTWRIRDGRCLAGKHAGQALVQQIGIMSYRRAWSVFHPESRSATSLD